MKLLTTLLAGFLCHALQVTAEASLEDKLKQKLGPLLSRDAVLTFPESDAWDRLTERHSSPRLDPDYVAVVEVATEKDVQNSIKVANSLNIPFLAVSSGHGLTSQINKVRRGLSINLRKLNSAKLNPSSGTVTVGGGIITHELLSFLAAKGKQAVHGLCQCISVVGPMLGGAHSILQSDKGFAADNLVSARVVLEDGSVVVASDKSNKELFWGLRGAGHNFGIVTSAEVRAYDVPDETWTIVTFWFTGDKLEDVFETWNTLEDEHDDPGLLVVNGHILRNPEVDAENPVMDVAIIYQGNHTAAEEYLAAFRAVGPAVDTTVSDIPWATLHDVGGFGAAQPVCQGGLNLLTAPNSFNRWDPEAMREGYDMLAEATLDELAGASGAYIILESYGRHGPLTVPAGTTAVAPEEREYHILMSVAFTWDGPATGPLAEAAARYAKALQVATRNDATRPHTYVNYASGPAPLPEVYGRDEGRLRRLKALKKTWDPKNRFGFYNPLA